VRAVCKTEPGRGGIAVCEREMRDPGPGEIRLKVAAAGICGTDMQIFHWAPRMARRMVLPRTLGHEVSGTVEAVGPGVASPPIGTRVALESHIYCGVCRSCRLGDAHLCVETTYPGIDIDGAFAEYITVPARIAWPIPDQMTFETAAMMEPFGIAVHAALAGGGVAGRNVLINGCGPIGLMCVSACRALGAARILACDPNPVRLATAERMGADIRIDPRDDDVVKRALAATNGYGVDVAIEFSGSEAGFHAAFGALCKGGDFRLVGAPPEAIPVDFTQWLLKCPSMQNIHGRRVWDTWQQASELVALGRADLAPIRSHVLPLSEGPRGFELILSGEAVKPLLVPDP
jgi:threonine 3-dehydrogenase